MCQFTSLLTEHFDSFPFVLFTRATDVAEKEGLLVMYSHVLFGPVTQRTLFRVLCDETK